MLGHVCEKCGKVVLAEYVQILPKDRYGEAREEPSPFPPEGITTLMVISRERQREIELCDDCYNELRAAVKRMMEELT